MSNVSEKNLKLTMKWLNMKIKHQSLVSCLTKRNYNTIAVYGMGNIGELFISELKESEVKIAYCIDRNAENIFCDHSIVTPDSELQDVDAVIVTAVSWFDEIEQDLTQKLDCPVISIEDLFYDL